MEDLYDACLIHGPGWFSEAMATEYPICKTGRRSRKDRLIWPCIYVYVLMLYIWSYFDEYN